MKDIKEYYAHNAKNIGANKEIIVVLIAIHHFIILKL
jgi:hypothetical protein